LQYATLTRCVLHTEGNQRLDVGTARE